MEISEALEAIDLEKKEKLKALRARLSSAPRSSLKEAQLARLKAKEAAVKDGPEGYAAKYANQPHQVEKRKIYDEAEQRKSALLHAAEQQMIDEQRLTSDLFGEDRK